MTTKTTEQARGPSRQVGSLLVHYGIDFTTANHGTSNRLCLECHRGKSRRRELNHSQLTYWVPSPVQLQFPVPACSVCSSQLRPSLRDALLKPPLPSLLRSLVPPDLLRRLRL